MSVRTAHRLSRLLAMLPWVMAHPGCSVEEVCNRFGYRREELLDDLNLVVVCGLPGYGPGDLMWAELVGDEIVVDTAEYFAHSPRLTPTESLTLLAAGMAVISGGHASGVLQKAVDKLAAAIAPGWEDSLSVELVTEPSSVEILRNAAASRNVVGIDYYSLSRNATNHRQVEPWAVFSTLGNWYLMGHCRTAGDRRVFRVDRIRDLNVTDERFVAPDNLPEPDVQYTPADDDVRATILLKDEARWVAQYYPVEIVEESPAGLTVVFSSSDPGLAARLLLRLGGGAELLAGEEVASSLAELKRQVLSRYS